TFAFFWTHTALWFYREWKERRERKSRQHVRTDLMPDHEERHFRRFPLLWRVAHLLFAVSLMTLTLTGMAVFFSHTRCAPLLIAMFGGPKAAGIVHRVAAVVFATVFVWHLFYAAIKIYREWDQFKIFGPNSFVPNLQDLKDIVDMFKWFFGMGPRPSFDRWTYWEKFDYWAPFWGVTIIGLSGVMLWFP